MPTYKVVAGKHSVKGDEGDTYIRQGETLELSEEEAAKFPGKFQLIAVDKAPIKDGGKGAPGTSAAGKGEEAGKTGGAGAPGAKTEPLKPAPHLKPIAPTGVTTPAVPVVAPKE